MMPDDSGHQLMNEFAYHLELVEDLDDGRFHEENEYLTYDDISRAGIRESIALYQVSKLFYADTGRILNIPSLPDDTNPVLLLKRDVEASLPSQMNLKPTRCQEGGGLGESDTQGGIDRQLTEESWGACSPEGFHKRVIMPAARPWLGLPQHLDPEWIAVEVFKEGAAADSDSDSNGDEDCSCVTCGNDAVKLAMPHTDGDKTSLDRGLVTQMKNISIGPSPCRRQKSLKHEPRTVAQDTSERDTRDETTFVARSPFGAVTTSLSLLEMLIRLATLQEFRQTSHLSIPDHVLTFFLEETSTTGVIGEESRWKVREDAKRKVGFDPYTDTPSR
jgi:hypothetical protein